MDTISLTNVCVCVCVLCPSKNVLHIIMSVKHLTDYLGHLLSFVLLLLLLLI